MTADIDAAHVLTGINELYKFLRSPCYAPEARLYAAAKLEALIAMAREGRRRRPDDVTIDEVRAWAGGLDSLRWRSKEYYASLFDHPGRYGVDAVPRECSDEQVVTRRKTG